MAMGDIMSAYGQQASPYTQALQQMGMQNAARMGYMSDASVVGIGVTAGSVSTHYATITSGGTVTVHPKKDSNVDWLDRRVNEMRVTL